MKLEALTDRREYVSYIHLIKLTYATSTMCDLEVASYKSEQQTKATNLSR